MRLDFVGCSSNSKIWWEPLGAIGENHLLHNRMDRNKLNVSMGARSKNDWKELMTVGCPNTFQSNFWSKSRIQHDILLSKGCVYKNISKTGDDLGTILGTTWKRLGEDLGTTWGRFGDD
jgi:hypothetical protein